MMNYEKKPHIITMLLLYFALFIIFFLDAVGIFFSLTIVNYFYSFFHYNINVNYDDILIMNVISSLLISLLLLFKKRKAIDESAHDFINDMNKLL